MMVFPSTLVAAAANAGIPTPPDPDDFNDMAFPQFAVFCAAQLGVPMSDGAHWHNASVIASIPESEVMKVSMYDLRNKGWIV